MADEAQNTILITGAAGTIGRLITPILQADDYHVRGLDRNESDLADSMVIGDITDPQAVADAMRGVHTLIHLAAYPNPAHLVDQLVEPNVIGLHHVFESAQKAGVQRVIFASSIQVVQGHYRTMAEGDTIDHTADAFPDNYYALTKVWAEQYGQMFAHLHGIPTLAVRIGWVVRNQSEYRKCESNPFCHSLYLSHGDCQRFFAAAVAASWTGFHSVFAVSRPAQRGVHIDMTAAGQLLDFSPQDTWPDGSPSIVPDALTD